MRRRFAHRASPAPGQGCRRRGCRPRRAGCGRLELGALEQEEEIGPVILAGSGGAGLHFLHDTGSLGGDVGEGLIYAFFCENAGHFIKDLAGAGGTLDLGEGSGQLINAGDPSGVSLLGGLAKALSFLPALGLLRIGKGGLPSAFDGLKQLGTDFSFVM